MPLSKINLGIAFSVKCLFSKLQKYLQNGKSPGLGGFTTELYKFFWSDLKYFAVRSFNQAYTRGYLSVSQRQGVITCLPKEGKSKFYLKKLAPLSILKRFERCPLFNTQLSEL
jgi:hypothetical protein